MPILNIEIVGELDDKVESGLASRIAEAAGLALNSRPHGTWVKLYYLSQDNYSENAGGPPRGEIPVIVSIIQANPPTGTELENQIDLLTDAVADCVKRPRENIHIVVEPAAHGRIAFGGKLQ